MGMLEACGFTFTQEPGQADLVILNTCAVREHAQDRVFGNVGALKNIKRRHPGTIIAVCGCMTEQEHVAERFKKSYPFVNIVFGTHVIHRLPEMLYTTLTDSKRVFLRGHEGEEVLEGIPTRRDGKSRAWVTVMLGCDNFCSYCIVPYVRGRERSRTPEDILAEVRKLAADGVKEVMLLGQNVNSYGKNLENPVSFAELLRMVNEVEGIERIRFMTSHPKDMSDELILAMKECDKVCKNLHLPFQSGSTEILKKMNRHYTKEGYLELVRKVREAMPEITLSTDIIVGFPGETEEDFQETLDVIRKARYCTAFTFIYSKRTGTPAAKMENQVPEDVVKDRFDRMLQVLNPIVHEVTEEQVGKVLPVLVEEVSKHDENILTGRTEQNTLVHFSGSKDLIGQMVPVKIIENKTFYVIGERI